MGDFEELEALRNGSREAYNSLVDMYSEKIFNFALNILQNTEDAEDITQETFVTIYQSVSQFKGDSKLSTWIYTIALNKCREHLRKKSRKKRFAFFTTIDKIDNESPFERAHFMHPGIELENQERASILFEAINALPENQRMAFSLHKLENVPYEEIATIMNTSLSSVESLIFRARKTLKTTLSSYYYENEK